MPPGLCLHPSRKSNGLDEGDDDDDDSNNSENNSLSGISGRSSFNSLSTAERDRKKRRYSEIEQLRGERSILSNSESDPDAMSDLDFEAGLNESQRSARFSGREGSSMPQARRRASSFGGRVSMGDVDSSFFSDGEDDEMEDDDDDDDDDEMEKDGGGGGDFDDAISEISSGGSNALSNQAIATLALLRANQEPGAKAKATKKVCGLGKTLRKLRVDRVRAARIFFNVLELHCVGLIAASQANDASVVASASDAEEEEEEAASVGKARFAEIEVVVFDE